MKSYPEGVMPLDRIESRENNIVKQSRKLKIKKYRQQNNRFVIEGIRSVEEAIESKAHVEYCLCSEALDNERIKALKETAFKKDIKFYTTKSGLVEELCGTETPQGIVAIVEKPNVDLKWLIDSKDFLIIADRLQDPGNLGTIIRTADAAGAEGVVLSQGTVDPYSPKVLRSTMGSIFHVPVISVPDIYDVIDTMKAKGFTIYVSSLEGNSAYYQESYAGKTVIVIGNEAKGADSEMIMKADRLIKIPMPGMAESLNAAVAGGILMFEVVRKRIQTHGKL